MAATPLPLFSLKIEPVEAGVAEVPPVIAGLLTTEVEATGNTLMGTSRWVFVRESKKITLYAPGISVVGIL